MLAFSLCVAFGSRLVSSTDACSFSGCLSSFQDVETALQGANLGLLQVGLKKERHVDEHSRDDVDSEFMQWLSNNSLTLLQGRAENPIVNAGALKDLQSYWSNMSQDNHISAMSSNRSSQEVHNSDDSNFVDLQHKQQLAFLQEVKTNAVCTYIAVCPPSAPENRGSGVSCSGAATTTCDAATCCKPPDINIHDFKFSAHPSTQGTQGRPASCNIANAVVANSALNDWINIDIDRCKVLDGRKFLLDKAVAEQGTDDWTFYYSEQPFNNNIVRDSCYVRYISLTAFTAHVHWNADPRDGSSAVTDQIHIYMCTKKKKLCGAATFDCSLYTEANKYLWAQGQCDWDATTSCTKRACCRTKDWVIPDTANACASPGVYLSNDLADRRGRAGMNWGDSANDGWATTSAAEKSQKYLCENFKSVTISGGSVTGAALQAAISPTIAEENLETKPKGCYLDVTTASPALKWNTHATGAVEANSRSICLQESATCDKYVGCSGSLPVNKGKGYYCDSFDEASCTSAHCCNPQASIVNFDDLFLPWPASGTENLGCEIQAADNVAIPAQALSSRDQCRAMANQNFRKGNDESSQIQEAFHAVNDVIIGSAAMVEAPSSNELCGCTYLTLSDNALKFNGHETCLSMKAGPTTIQPICKMNAPATCASYTCPVWSRELSNRPVRVASTTNCYGGMQRSCTVATCCRSKTLYASAIGSCCDSTSASNVDEDRTSEYIYNETVCRGLIGLNANLFAQNPAQTASVVMTSLSATDPFAIATSASQACGCYILGSGVPLVVATRTGTLTYNPQSTGGLGVTCPRANYLKADTRVVCSKPKANCGGFNGCWGTKPINLGQSAPCPTGDPTSCTLDTCCRAQAFYAFHQTHCRTGEMITDQATCQNLGGVTLYANATDGRKGYKNFVITWAGAAQEQNEACGCYGNTGMGAGNRNLNIRYNTLCPMPAVTPRNYVVCKKINATCDAIASCPADKPGRKTGVICPTADAASCTPELCCQVPVTSDYYATGSACPTGYQIKDSASCQALNATFIYNQTNSSHFFNVLWSNFSYIANASRSLGCGCYLNSNGWNAQMYWNNKSCDHKDTQVIKDLIVCEKRSTCDTYNCPSTLPTKNSGKYCPSFAATSCTDSICCKAKLGPPQTTLTAAVEVGAKTLHVAIVNGFESDKDILIKSSNEEANVIAGIGSLLLKYPLKFTHTVGATVTQLPPDDPKIKALVRKPSLYGKTVKLPNWLDFGDIFRYYKEMVQVLICQNCEAFTLSQNKCPTYLKDIKIAQYCEQCEEWLRDACAAFPPEGYEKVGEGKCQDSSGRVVKSADGIQTNFTADNPYNCKALCEAEKGCSSFETNKQGCQYYKSLEATKGDGSKDSTCYAKAAAKKKAFFR